MEINLADVSKMVFVKNEDGTFSLDLKSKIYSSDDCGVPTPYGNVEIKYPRIVIKSLDINALQNDGKCCTYLYNI